MTDEEIISAFHLMWDNFPEPVMITQKAAKWLRSIKKEAPQGRGAARVESVMRTPRAVFLCQRFFLAERNADIFLKSKHHVYEISHIRNISHIDKRAAGIKRNGVELFTEHSLGFWEKPVALSVGSFNLSGCLVG